MDMIRSDTVARLITERKLSRRAVLAQGAAGLAAGALAASGLATLANTSGAAATQASDDSDFAGLVDIGGRSLWLEGRGAGGPTVILESGFGNNAQWWEPIALPPDSDETAVLPGVADFTRVYAYDRPGTILDADHRSRSDPVPMPRTAADVVADLHELLAEAEVPGPYVLVGHSFGGLVVRLYAATYPDDPVAGMVLVDAADEGLHDRLRAAMTPAQWEVYDRLSKQVSPEVAEYPGLERVDLDASFAQMREAAATHPLPSMPMVVLTRGVSPLATDPDSDEAQADIPESFPLDVIEPAWQAGQADLAELVPDTEWVIATESAHWVQVDQPGLVIEAIHKVVDAVRDPETWTT